MSLFKQARDQFIRFALGRDGVPSGLAELSHYLRFNEPISFRLEKQDDGSYVATSQGFRHGSIVTAGRDSQEIEEHIKDAILTSFEVPSSYAREADLRRVDETKQGYAFA
ncbi:MAG: hypothetical protein V1723_01040 [Candidatus Uhrbacteria bacterium]